MTYSYAGERFKATPMPDAKLSRSSATNQKESSVATPSLSYQRMQAWWDVIDAVRGGTWKLRELGEAYLPKEPREGDDAYHRRLCRTVLSPWYIRLVRGLVGMVLRKPIKADVSAEIEAHLEDINLQGDNLQTFAKDVFESAIDYNYAGILVEYPATEGLESRADEIAAGVRPYWVLYPATDILKLRFAQVGSTRFLTQVRLRQTVTEEVGEFGEAEVEQILVYDLVAIGGEGEELQQRVRWRIFREEETRDGKKEWLLYDEGLLSLAEIPFAICYTDKKQRLELQPPMLEVAYLNLKHYQLQADLDHALHISAIPRMFLFGTSPEEIGEIGSVDEAVCIPNPDAKVEWSSPKIDAFAPLQTRITEAESQMGVLGLSMLVSQKNVGESAEAKRLDRTQGDSMMAVIAQSLQQALNQALKFHALYIGESKAPSCQVSRDFDLTQLSPQMLSALHGVRQGGDLSQETFLQLLQQGEIGLPDDWTPQAEQKRLATEFKKEAAPRSSSTDEDY